MQKTQADTKKLAKLVYILQIIGLTFIPAVIVNYLKRNKVKGTLAESHFHWQIRTFWFGSLWAILGGGLTFFAIWADLEPETIKEIIIDVFGIIGILVFVTNIIWIFYRIIRGWLALNSGKAMYASSKEENAKSIAISVYFFQTLVTTFIPAVIVNYLKRKEIKGTLAESHFRWQIRTFWFGLLWAVLGGSLTFLAILTDLESGIVLEFVIKGNFVAALAMILEVIIIGSFITALKVLLIFVFYVIGILVFFTPSRFK